MKCKSCGTELISFSFQARSADEAATNVTRCSKCPIDISKLSNSIKHAHLHLARTTKQKNHLPEIDTSNASTTYRIRSVVHNKCEYDISLKQAYGNCIDQNSHIYRQYVEGMRKGYAVRVMYSKLIGPDTYMDLLSIIKSNIHIDKIYTADKYTTLNEYSIMQSDSKYIATLDIIDDTDENVSAAINSLYINFGYPDSLVSYISPVILNGTSNLSARGFDSSEPQYNDPIYSVKPDGERMWLSRIGMVWLFSRRLLNHKVCGWWLIDKYSNIGTKSIGPILDIEFMIGVPHIVIDILLSDESILSQPDRNVISFLQTYIEMSTRIPLLKKLSIKQYSYDISNIKTILENSLYPCDGIIAMSEHSMEITKLKPTKSIELKLVDTSQLISASGTVLFNISNHSYVDGSILELRFKFINNRVTITDVFQRTDKTKANDDTAISRILESATSISTNELRIAMWRWSDLLRQFIYMQAIDISNQKVNTSIILDIGSGDGQSSDVMIRNPNNSYILIEPDPIKCTKLSRKLRTEVNTDPRSINRVIGQLIKNRKKYHIVNCKLSDIASDASICRNIKGYIGCVVASFSAQFIIDELKWIYDMQFPFIGSCYTYDNVDIGSSIINTDSIKMTRISDYKATVKWGSDKIYEEPAIDSKTLPDFVSCINSTMFIEVQDSKLYNTMSKLCEYIKVLRF